MSLTATCHCGNISVVVPWTPNWINDCQCGVCYRYGAGWAYYPVEEVEIRNMSGKSTQGYVREGGMLAFHFCKECGCMMYWWPADPDPKDPEGLGVNTNNMPVEKLRKVERRTMYDMND